MDQLLLGGAPHAGGDSSAVQDQLKNVQQVQATSMVFAAILTGESVVTWGLQVLLGTALLQDGSVVAWGHEEYGGDSSAVEDQIAAL